MTASLRSPAPSPARRLHPGRPLLLAGIADGAEGLVLADLARTIAGGCRAAGDQPRGDLPRRHAHGDAVARARLLRAGHRDDRIPGLGLPALRPGVAACRTWWRSAWRRWRGSPAPRADDRPAVVLTTVNAALQRVVPREIVAKQSLSAAAGTLLPMARVTQWLELNGFTRAATVREPGDYAVRGGIVDLFAPGMDAPVRLDFFGDTLESIRRFDPETQRTTDELRTLELVPMAEFQLTAETIRLFRTGYVAAFGAAGPDDMLYEAVSDGRRTAGVEHWLPLFHPHLDTLFDYLERRRPIAIEPLAEEAAHERLAQIADYYQARKDALDQAGAGAPYKPLPPDRLYLPEAEWRERLEKSALARLSPFAAPEGTADAIEIGARAGHNFAAERSEPGTNVFEAVRKHVETLQAAGKRVVIALWSEGSRERMAHVLAEHGLFNLDAGRLMAAGAGALAAPRPRSPCSASMPASRPPMSR